MFTTQASAAAHAPILALLHDTLIEVYNFWGDIEVKANVIKEYVLHKLYTIKEAQPSTESRSEATLIALHAEETVILIDWLDQNRLLHHILLGINPIVDETRFWIQMLYYQKKLNCDVSIVVDSVENSSIKVTLLHPLPDQPSTERIPLLEPRCTVQKQIVEDTTEKSNSLSKSKRLRGNKRKSNKAMKETEIDNEQDPVAASENQTLDQLQVPAIYRDLIKTCIDTCQLVYELYGWSLKESQYEERLIYHLTSDSGNFLRDTVKICKQTQIPVTFPTQTLHNYREPHLFRTDLCIQHVATQSNLIVELKATDNIEQAVHQTSQYLDQSNLQYALICGFPSKPKNELSFIVVQMMQSSTNSTGDTSVNKKIVTFAPVTRNCIANEALQNVIENISEPSLKKLHLPASFPQ